MQIATADYNWYFIYRLHDLISKDVATNRTQVVCSFIQVPRDKVDVARKGPAKWFR
jgi:hypothetical protein